MRGKERMGIRFAELGVLDMYDQSFKSSLLAKQAIISINLPHPFVEQCIFVPSHGEQVEPSLHLITQLSYAPLPSFHISDDTLVHFKNKK